MARAAVAPVYTEIPSMGIDGRTVLAGARAPLVTDGRVGDFWVDTAGKRLYGPKTAAGWTDRGLIKGDRGWVPVLAAVTDGTRRVHRVIDWTGGEGTKPATGSYVGATGLVALIADAVDMRGPEGPAMLIDELDAGADDIGYDDNAPFAKTGGDNKRQPLKRLLGAGGLLQFDSVADAEGLVVPASVKSVQINGASRAEGGPGHIRSRVDSEPSSGFKHRSADRFTSDGGSDSANGGWWAAVDGVAWSRGPGIIRSAQDVARNGWALFDFIDPTKHSAIRGSTDLTDLTIPIQSALDSGEELKAGRGRYYISGVDVPTKTRLRGEGKDKVSFMLANGSNRSAFKLPLTDTSVGDFEQPVLEGFFLDANGNEQSGTSYGIELPNAGFSLGTAYGSAVTMNGVQVESARSGNLFSGTNRGAGFINDCIFRYSLTDVVTINGYDWRIKGGDIGGSGVGGSATGNCLTLASGGALTLIGVNIFGAPQIGVAVSALVNNFVDIIGCSLDLHGREALAASYVAGQRVALIGGRVGSNSKEGANTYSHVRFSGNSTAHAIVGTVFERGATAAKHIVEFQGTCEPILFGAIYPTDGTAPYQTSLTNDLSRLKFAGTGSGGWVGTMSDGSISMGVGSSETFKADANQMLLLRALRMQGATPRLWWQETDAPANSGRHMFDVESGELRGFLVNDAESTFAKWLSLTRSGTALGRLKFDVTGGKLALAGLPTSAAGLSSGDVWLNANVLTIVP